jgi:hypothetical protein
MTNHWSICLLLTCPLRPVPLSWLVACVVLYCVVQARVQKRVMFSGALPISRDTPSYAAVMSILNGGEAGQLDYARRYDPSEPFF